MAKPRDDKTKHNLMQSTMEKQDDKTKLVLKILVVLLALLSLALLIALIVVATKDKTKPVENGSSSAGVKEFWDHVYYRWSRSIYRPTVGRYIGRLSADYRSTIGR